MEFSPKTRSFVELRSSKTSNPPEIESESCNTDSTETLVAVAGKYFAVLADSPEGYYIVKCVSVSGDQFSGQYLEQQSEQHSENVVFKETNEKDVFRCETVLVEVESVKSLVMSTRLKKVSVTKEELDNILLKIAQIDAE